MHGAIQCYLDTVRWPASSSCATDDQPCGTPAPPQPVYSRSDLTTVAFASSRSLHRRYWKTFMGIPSMLHDHSISITQLSPSTQLVETLEGMNKTFAYPYIIFFPTVSRDGMPFPINKCILEIQGSAFSERTAWRGNLVIAKYHDHPWNSLLDMNMADYPLLRNYFMAHGPPSH
jgi:hypothetical protein